MDLLSQRLANKGTLFHPDLKSLRLAAWKLSGVSSKVQAFHRQLLPQPWPSHDNLHDMSTTPDGMHSVAGVVNKRLIPFGRL